MSDHFETLATRVEAVLGKPEDWPKWRGGWLHRADLALLDAVYSTRQEYETTVLPKVLKWRDKYAQPRQPELEYLAQLSAAEIQNAFGANRLPGVKPSRYKSEGVIETAKRLVSLSPQLASAEMIVEAVNHGHSKSVRSELERTKGVGPATSSYFLILLGVDGVKVDTLLGRWVRRETKDELIRNEEIEALVGKVATDHFNVNKQQLDYAIWRHESTKPRTRGRSAAKSR
jgi:hypothetical protein